MGIVDYITAQEAAEKWEITRRRVQILCVEGRIQGAIKKANLWLIPSNAEKPLDRRKKIYNHIYKNIGEAKNE